MMLNRTQRIHSFAAAVLMWLGVAVSPVGAYEVIDVQHGGTVDGTVTLSGGIPDPKAFNLITFPSRNDSRLRINQLITLFNCF